MSFADQFPMEEVRNIYLAKLGETVNGKLRLYGDWVLGKRGALGSTEGESRPFFYLTYWVTFQQGNYTYIASCSVDLNYHPTTIEGQKDQFYPSKPFTNECSGYSVKLVIASSELATPDPMHFTTTRRITEGFN